MRYGREEEKLDDGQVPLGSMVSGTFSPADVVRQKTQNKKQTAEASAEDSQSADLRLSEGETLKKTELELWQRKSHSFYQWLDEEDSWYQTGAEDSFSILPTHIRPFRSHEEYKLVQQTFEQLLHSSYYWGSISMDKAHKILSDTPQGTFLVRDSCQPNVFFTLTYQREDGPTSVRIHLNNLRFNLCGSEKSFPTLFSLLGFYSGYKGKLKLPYRRQRPEDLKQLCRRAMIGSYGAQSIHTLPGLSGEVRDFVHAYPYQL